MKNYIGLDAHSTTCTFVTVDEVGKEISKAKVFTQERALVKYVQSVPGEKILTFEESNLSQWLYVVLKKEVAHLTVCNPLYLGKKPGAKTDYRDALHLANELRCNHVTSVYHDEANEFIELRTLISGYLDHVQEKTRAKNRYKALFRSQALPAQGTKIYSNEERIKELNSVSARIVAKNIFDQIQRNKEVQKNYEEHFKKNAKKTKLLKKLCTIPGMGLIRAHLVLAIICDGKRFKNKHLLWSYAGLVKHIDVSNDVVCGKRSTHGRAELKFAYMGCAQTIIQQRSGNLRKYYDNLRDNGIGHKQAQKSLARKVAAISLMILKTGKSYNEKFEEKTIEIENTI